MSCYTTTNAPACESVGSTAPLIREDGASYSASEPEHRGALLGHELRLTRELMTGLTADQERRRHAISARHAPVDADGAIARPPLEVPGDLAALSDRLHRLATAADCDLAEQLVLLLAFDRQEGWRSQGCASCVSWMSRCLGIASSTGYERLQVARELESLPYIAALFRVGRLSWSKVRLLCRVADADNEIALGVAALDLSVSACQRLCNDYRHARSASANDDDRAAFDAFEQRSLTCRYLDSHSVEIRLRLPTDRAAEFIASLELHEESLREDGGNDAAEPHPDTTARQRRADATLLMASKSLAAVVEPVVTADRYRVHITSPLAAVTGDADETPTPAARPVLRGFGPIAPATAQRICCDAGLSIVATGEAGDIVDVGRRQRAWPARLRTAIIAEQGCCQVPGCGATRWLDVHHVVPWQHGGETSASNAAVVCRRCHVMLHEGGFSLVRESHEDTDARLRGTDPSLSGNELHAAVTAVRCVAPFRLVFPAESADYARVESLAGDQRTTPTLHR